MASKATSDVSPPRPILQPKRPTKTRQTTSYSKGSALVSNSQQRVEAKEQLILNQRRLRNEQLFDEFMENTLSMPLTEAFEPRIREMFEAERCVLWIDQPEKQCLTNSSFSLIASYTKSVPGIVFRSRELLHVKEASQTPGGFLSDPRIASPNSPQLFIPLIALGTPRGVAQIVKRQGAPAFTDFEMKTAALVMKKFDIYGDSFFTAKALADIALSLYSSDGGEVNPVELLRKQFKSDVAELWSFDIVRNAGRKYDPELREMIPISCESYGVVGFAVASRTVVNSVDVTQDPHYAEAIDGCVKGPVLSLSTQFGERTAWAVVLRRKAKEFSTFHEVHLKAVLPFAVKSVAGFTDEFEESNFNSQLAELLDAATIMTSKTDVAELAGVIEEQMKKILMAEACVLMLVDNKNGGMLCRGKRIQSDQGVAGKALRSRTIVSFDNPVKDPQLNFVLDCDEEYLPSSLLAVPIFDVYGRVIAVAVAVSKLKEESFDTDDERVASALAIFAGIALESARKYKRSVTLIEKLREFVEKTLHTNEEADLKPLLSKIVSRSKKIMECSRVTVYVCDGATNNLNVLLNAGDTSDSVKIAAESVRKQSQVVRDLGPRVGATTRSYELSSACVSSIFEEREIPESQPGADTPVIVCCKPLMNDESVVLGVLEIEFLGDIGGAEQVVIDSLASLLTLSLERMQLHELTPFGYGQLNPNDWIDETEKTLTKIPQKLYLDNRGAVFDINFNASEFDGIGHFKVLFALFDEFGLLDEFDIHAESLFRFISELRGTYNRIPYHNWRHAVDVCQFVASLIHLGQLQTVFTKQDILSLLVSALSHDAGHEGFNSQNGPPISLLYQSESVIEAHHCSVLITVMTKTNCNIFKNLPEDRLESIWNEIFELILSTDMARHFDILKEIENITDSFNITDSEHRHLLMKLLLKCGDLSLAARSYATLKSCKSIADEFFEQGDRSRVPSMKLRGRDMRCVYAFMSDVCLPMFKLLAKILPNLASVASAVTDNVETWNP